MKTLVVVTANKIAMGSKVTEVRSSAGPTRSERTGGSTGSRTRAKGAGSGDGQKDHNRVNSKVVSKAAHKAVAHKTVRDNMVAQRGVRKEMPGATIDSSLPNGANDSATPRSPTSVARRYYDGSGATTG